MWVVSAVEEGATVGPVAPGEVAVVRTGEVGVGTREEEWGTVELVATGEEAMVFEVGEV